MEELKQKAVQIKLIAFDVDGVLTNGEIIYTDGGQEIKVFDAKDGQGIVMLNKSGMTTAVITARNTPIVNKRAQELGITHVYQGAKNKIIAMQELMDTYKLDFSEIAYVGDDIPDICILEKAGLACCPADAVDEVKAICNFISTRPGGRGAVREIANFILASRLIMLFCFVSSPLLISRASPHKCK